MKKNVCNIKILRILVSVVALAACTKTPVSPEVHEKAPSETTAPIFHVNLLNQDASRFQEGESFDIKQVIGLEQAISGKKPWISNSGDIFRLAEKSMLLGNLASGGERNQFEIFGHQLLQLFYGSNENTTQFNKDSTIYMKAALGFEGQNIMNLFKNYCSPENIKKVQSVFDSNIQIRWPAQVPTLHPAEFITSIKSYLGQVVQAFKTFGVSKEFTVQFTSEINTDYMTFLDQGEQDLRSVDDKRELLFNADLITKVMGTLKFIPQDVLSGIMKQLKLAHDYGVYLQKDPNIKNEDFANNLIKVITGVWVDLKTDDQRQKYIKTINPTLYEKLSARSENQIEGLAGRKDPGFPDSELISLIIRPEFIKALERSCHSDVHDKLQTWEKLTDPQKPDFQKKYPELFEVFSRYSYSEITNDILSQYSNKDKTFSEDTDAAKKFVEDLGSVCLNSVDDLLDPAINKYMLTQLDTQIRAFGPAVTQAVKSQTMANLQQIADGITSPEKFIEYFKTKAYPMMDQKLFNKTPTLPAVENNRVQLYVSSESKLSTKTVSDGKFQTGADVLGESLSANYYRIRGMPEFEHIAATDFDYMKYVFIQINKMLSMLGFRDFNRDLVPSLHRLFIGKHTEMDIYRYDCTPEKLKHQQEVLAQTGVAPEWREDCTGATDFNNDLYAIPDKLGMVSDFTPDDGAFPKTASASGQAEIIRGVALMLQYFKDWGKQPDDYSIGMGQFKLGDIKVFPREAFVNLTIGLMTTPVRSFKKPTNPLRLFNVLGDEIQNWFQKDIFSNDPEKTAQRNNNPSLQLAQAAVVGFTPAGISNTVTVKDLASYIIAMDEFLNSLDGVESTNAPLVKPKDGSHDILDALKDGCRQLKMLMYGMEGFLVTRMQDNDGGFWHSYTMKNGQAVVNKNEPRTLEDQELVIEAMMRVYHQWHNNFAIKAATEAYYFMNQKLWSDDSHFYASDETTKVTELKPDVYLSTLLAIKMLTPYLTAESQQQAKKIYSFYSSEFLNWNKVNQPFE